MIKQLQACSLAEDQSSVPSTHIGQLTTACDYRQDRGPNPSDPRALARTAHGPLQLENFTHLRMSETLRLHQYLCYCNGVF